MAATGNSRPAETVADAAAFLATRIGPGETVCVGLSGGCDSVVLLHLALAAGLGARLRAIHVNHGLSPNAGAWADWCGDLCQRLAVPLTVKTVSVDRASGSGVEAAARAARYEVFTGCECDVILLAHHRGDQAETLLFNLLRGTGMTGAGAMRAERWHGGLRILRPLLATGRDEIEAYARAAGIDWVDDESNRDEALTRNFLRRQVLPLVASRFAAAERNLARAAGHFAEADALLDELAALDWQSGADGDALRLEGLRLLAPARLANLLRYRLRQLGWRTPDAARLAEFCRQVQVAGPDRHPELSMPEGRMLAARGRLRWLPSK
jgi:tRNA(Ile)-lysidine synthase